MLTWYLVFTYPILTYQGIARTQSPTNKNYALELPTFGVIVGVSPTEVQWKGLTLEEPPSWSRLTSVPGKYEEEWGGRPSHLGTDSQAFVRSVNVLVHLNIHAKFLINEAYYEDNHHLWLLGILFNSSLLRLVRKWLWKCPSSNKIVNSIILLSLSF